MSIPSTRSRARRGRSRSVLLALALVLGLLAAVSPAMADDPGSASADPTAAEAITVSDLLQPRIYRGVDASIADLPWVVLIASADGGCTGSVIAPRWVLTAAHCFESNNPANLQIGIGGDDLNVGFTEVLTASRVIRHPQYNPSTLFRDIALIELAQPTSAPPVALAAAGPPNYAGQTATIAGWGVVRDNPDGSQIDTDRLQRASVQVRDHSVCVDGYANETFVYDPATYVCAGGPISDACQGDSGGPLVLGAGTGASQIGIVSSGEACNEDSSLAGAYTAVAPYRTWIDQTIATSTDPDPVDPVDPTDPIDPVDPVDPTDPVDPVAPTDPTDPGEQELGPQGDCSSDQPLPSGVQNGLQMGFESGSLEGRWTIGQLTDEIRVVGTEQIGVPGQDDWARTATPLAGSRMLRLAAAHESSGQRQNIGPNEVCQDFRVVNNVERFAFNVFTFDYTGYDEFRYDLTLLDGSGTTIATYSQGAFGAAGDTRLKTSGWRSVQLDLSAFQGQIVRLTVAAGGTRDTQYGFWTYLDSATGGEIIVPTQPDTVVVERPTNTSVWVNPSTGLFTVSVVAGRTPGDLHLAMPVSCEVGEVTQARFAFNNIVYEAEVIGGIAYGTIPGHAIAQGASFTAKNVNLLVDCSDGSTSSTVIGSIVLYDPSGFLTDAVTGAPVVDAEVTLHRVPDWQPRTGPGDTRPDTCESHLSKPAGALWSQPAPTHLGVEEPAASQRISPNVNPFTSDDSGYYGWDVAEGCWYVTVEAEGYQPLTSPVVGVPPEVTDLDLSLTPTGTAPPPTDPTDPTDPTQPITPPPTDPIAPPPGAGISFIDVPAGFVHEPGIQAVAAAGITTGCAPGRYCPSDPVTRGQMATFLMRTLNLNDPGGSPFMDVPASFVHAPGIRAVAAAGITTGCAPGRYCPSDSVTRGQMASFLMRAAQLPPGPLPTPFADVPTTFVHAPAISAVAQAGITGGCAPGRYCPGDEVTRGQMATFLYRAFLQEAVG